MAEYLGQPKPESRPTPKIKSFADRMRGIGAGLAAMGGNMSPMQQLQSEDARAMQLQKQAQQEAQKQEQQQYARTQQQESKAFQKEKFQYEKDKDKADRMFKKEQAKLKTLATNVKEPKANQFQAALFGKRIEEAENVFNQLTQSGVDATSKTFALSRMSPEFMKPEETKMQEQAERNFVNAVLRRESGAAIAESEFDSAEKQYFPRIGDTPRVLEQKRRNRQLALQGIKAEAGGAWERSGQLSPLNSQPARTGMVAQGINKGIDMLSPTSAQAAEPQQYEMMSDADLLKLYNARMGIK